MDSSRLLILRRKQEQRTHVERELLVLAPILFRRIIMAKRTTSTRARRSHSRQTSHQRLNKQPLSRESAMCARVRITSLGSVRTKGMKSANMVISETGGTSGYCLRSLCAKFDHQLDSIIKKNYTSYSHICITNLVPQLFWRFAHFR